MGSRIRLMLGLEAAIFFIAALIHFEVLFDGYPDREAATAESIIGFVLLAGLVFVTLVPSRTRMVALIVQGFALAGTFVGLTLLFTIGPITSLDVVIHLVMVAVLITGLVITWSTRPPFHQPLERVSGGESRR
jgi:hypothetical protein